MLAEIEVTSFESPLPEAFSPVGDFYFRNRGIIQEMSETGTRDNLYDSFGPKDRETLTTMVVRLEYLTKTVDQLADAVPQKTEVAALKIEQAALRGEVETLKQFRWQMLGVVLVLNALTAFVAARLVISPVQPSAVTIQQQPGPVVTLPPTPVGKP